MAGIKEEKKIYLVGIYCRLSKDDGTDNESASIATQKSILTDYDEKAGMAHSKKRMWTMVILVQILLGLDSDTFLHLPCCGGHG